MAKSTPTQAKATREQTIVRAGAVAILTNFLLAGFKIAVGLVSNSLAIISDSVHGLIDAISGVIVIVGEKLASHERLAKNRHQVERTTTAVIAVIIIIVGVHIFIESIEKIITPETPDYRPAAIIILIASIIAKLLLSAYLRRTGRRVKADTLIASGIESLNDVLIGTAVLASALIFLVWGVDIEAYISILISFLIIKFGLEFIFPKFFHHHHIHHGQPHQGHEPRHQDHLHRRSK